MLSRSRGEKEAAKSYKYLWRDKIWEWLGEEAKGRNKEMGKWEEGTFDFIS